jgi:hypothetical protein
LNILFPLTRGPYAGGTAVADKPVCERCGALKCP